MALLKCPDCEKMVSPRVNACPFCGCPREFFEDPSKTEEETPVQDAMEAEIEELARELDDELEEDEFDEEEDEEDDEDEEDEEDDDLIYKIGNYELEIPVEVQNERFISKRLSPLIAKVGPDFEKNYSNQGDCSSVLKRSSELAFAALYPLIDECVEILNEQGIYSMDSAGFCTKYCKGFLEDYNDVLANMENRLYQIEKQQAEEKYYRELRKEGRSRVVGGGFGLGGAIKGMATAGAINAATGMAHSLGNAIGNAGSGIAASSNRAGVFKDSKQPLKEAVVSAAYIVKAGLREALRLEANIRCKYVTKSEANEADAILNNSRQGRIPKNEDLKMLLRALMLNPFEIDTYVWIWEQYGDNNNGLREMAEYFGVGLDSKIRYAAIQYGTKMFESGCASYIKAFDKEKALIDMEEKLQEVLQCLVNYCKERQLEETCIDEIEKCRRLLDEADILQRTFNGQVYESRELAKCVAADYEQFYELLEGKDLNDPQTWELLKSQTFTTNVFENLLPELFEKEKNLRNPEKIWENIFGIVTDYREKGLLGKAQIIVPGYLGDYSQKEQNVNLVTSMPSNEVPLILFERSNINKSAVLLTNRYVRVFSKLLFVHENTTYEIEKTKQVICMSSDRFILQCEEISGGEFPLKLGDESAKTQIAVGKMITEILALIRRLPQQAREDLANILYKTEKVTGEIVVPEKMSSQDTIFCTSCGKTISRGAKFCNFCGSKNNYKG